MFKVSHRGRCSEGSADVLRSCIHLQNPEIVAESSSRAHAEIFCGAARLEFLLTFSNQSILMRWFQIAEMDQDNHCDSHDQGAAFQRAIDNNPSCDSEMVADFQFKSHETGVKGTSHPGHDPQNQVEASPEGPTANDAMDVD
jgi:hypothetical protein